ncbi:MAG: stage II sporulation protein M [Anaerolineales bacterium]
MDGFLALIFRALRRARGSILAVAIVYFLAVLTGGVMVHTGSSFALQYRDIVVQDAQAGTVLTQPDPLRMALADFQGNLVGATTDTLGGLGVVFPFPLVAYRGWVGGIVSVDGSHASRLADLQSAAYYISTLLLQLSGYTLAAGAGVNVGLSLWWARPYSAGDKWLGMPKEALRDLLRIYALVIPILLIASLWEFLSPLNF